MKFLCVDCDEQMHFAQRQIPGDGTMAAVFECEACDRAVAMLTNPMETQLVSSLGVQIGGRGVPEQPLEETRKQVATGREDAFDEEEAEGASAGDGPAADGPGPVEWSPAAVERLSRVPSFVRGMVRRIYTDWAEERDIRTITPEIMDRARSDLGLEGM